jgi:hypothetical protein
MAATVLAQELAPAGVDVVFGAPFVNIVWVCHDDYGTSQDMLGLLTRVPVAGTQCVGTKVPTITALMAAARPGRGGRPGAP